MSNNNQSNPTGARTSLVLRLCGAMACMALGASQMAGAAETRNPPPSEFSEARGAAHPSQSDEQNSPSSEPSDAAHLATFATMMSTCDPDNVLSQACCNALAAAHDSVSWANALAVCDPSITSVPYTGTPPASDCIDSSCNGPASCKALKKACVIGNGNWSCSRTDGGGNCTKGKCGKCYS